MSQNRENIVEMIDKGLSANRQYGFCTCGYRDGVFYKCNYCIISDALMASRVCISVCARREDRIVAKIVAGQKEVEKKLKELMKKEGGKDD